MKLLNDFGILCDDCNYMRDLLSVLSNGAFKQVEWVDRKIEQNMAAYEEIGGALKIASKMQEKISDMCWDILYDLNALIKNQEVPIGYTKLDDDEEKLLKSFRELDDFNKKCIMIRCQGVREVEEGSVVKGQGEAETP